MINNKNMVLNAFSRANSNTEPIQLVKLLKAQNNGVVFADKN